MFITLAAIWIISPLVMLPLLIVYVSQSFNLKKENKSLKDQIWCLKHNQPSVNPEPVQQNIMPVPPQSNTLDNQNNYYPASPDSVTPVENIPPQPVPLHDVPQQQGNPMPMPMPAPVYTPQPDYYEKPVRHNGVSTINIVLITGTLLVILSGIVFAATTWQALPDILKTITLFSFSAVFFAVSSLAERKLNLTKTGTAFFTLGSFFLPITIFAAGILGLFGEWFSLYGEGRFLLMSVSFLAFSWLALKGSSDYKNPAFAWGSLASFSAGVVLLLRQITGESDVFVLLAAVWGFGVIILSEKLTQYDSDRYSVVLSQLNAFSIGNTFLLALLTIFASGNTAIAFVACMIFACGFMRNAFTNKSGYAGAAPFMTLMVTALYKLIEPNAVDGFVFIAAAASAVLTILSLMNFFGDGVKKAFSNISAGASALILVISGLTILMGDKPTPLMLASFAVLTANTIWLGFKNNKNKVILSAASCEFIILAAGLARILSDKLYVCTAAVFAFTALLLLAYIFIQNVPFRNSFTDILFPSVMTLSVMIMLFSGSKTYAPITILCSAINTVAVFLLYMNTDKFKSFWRYWLIFTSTLICYPIAKTINILYETIDTDVAFINVFRIFTCTVMLIGGVIYALSVKKEKLKTWNIPFMVSIVFFSAIALLISIGEGSGYPVIIALTLYCALRAFVSEKTEKTPFVLSLIGSMISIYSVVSYYIDDVDFYVYALLAVIPAVIGYIAYEALRAKQSEFRYSKQLYLTSTISMCTISSITALSLIFNDTGEHMKWLCFTDAIYSTCVILTIILTAIAVLSCYRTKKTLPALAPAIIGLYLIVQRLDVIGLSRNINLFMSCILVLTAVLVLTGRLLHRNLVIEQNENKSFYADIFSISAIFIIPAFIFYGDENWRWGIQLILSALSLAIFSGRTKSKTAEKALVSISSFLCITAWWSQPFFTIPSLISLELNLAPLFLFCLALKFIWRGKEKAVEIITFSIAVITAVILFIAGNISQLLEDALILVVSSLALLITSFILKRKKWFLLAVIVLIITTVFMTKAFWMSLAWWIYLLVAGILLIAIGALNEMKKQNVGKNIGKKLTRFMSDWTW